MSERVTTLLTAIDTGDAAAGDELVALLYAELQDMARAMMSREKARGAGFTLQPTALVHDAWMRLGGADVAWNGRGHFMGAAAQAMRRILVERARRKAAPKHGGGRDRIELDEAEVALPEPDVDLVALDEAMTRLETHDARKAQVVQLRYFAGLGVEEVADLLGISKTTVKSDWSYARLWLFREMG